MNHDFQSLLEFLNRCGPEVTGRFLATPETEEAAKLIRFAAGECDEAERTEVYQMLHVHPAWLRFVADRVRAARATAEAA